MNLIDKDALKRNLCVNTKYGTYSECTDGSEVTFTSREIDRIIDEQPIISIISENNPLTIDEVKALKKGDVVWLKTESKVCEIEIDAIKPPNSNSVWYFTSYMRLTCFSLSELNKNYFLYRHKPQEKEEQLNAKT